MSFGMPIWKRTKTLKLSVAKERALLAKAKKGNKKAAKQLFLAYSHSIVKTASHRMSPKHHMIDFLETANLAFLKAIKTYSVKEKSRFWPYAKRRVDRALSELKRK